MSPNETKRIHVWWEPVWELVIHILVGSLLFAIIFAPAILLDFLVEWLKDKLSEFLAGLLSLTKYAVAVFDVVLYLLYMLVMAALFIRGLWRLLVRQWSSESDG